MNKDLTKEVRKMLELAERDIKEEIYARPIIPDKLIPILERFLELEELVDAAIELVAVAYVRGDSELPHPADDPLLWTARCQDAWGDLVDVIDKVRPGELSKEITNIEKSQ